MTSKDKSYFDLHITGLGYLNRIREVKPKKGDTFLACDIAALNGPSDDVSYVRFDTRVSGSEAQHLVRRCIEAVEAGKKVMIGFRLGDLSGLCQFFADDLPLADGQEDHGVAIHLGRCT
ncbi:hypothetical protein FACS1894158_06050 [Betaproteobacteria bacterium]|nr:hypothetical protein FACS1894158_06050 [Betaproteobacteria bacterium]